MSKDRLGSGEAEPDPSYGGSVLDQVPPVHYAPARGARIAYQRFGSGPTVVAIPPMAQNVDLCWEWPAIRSMLERFGSFSEWVHFDKRGTGASDRRTVVPGLDERVDDVRAVFDDADIDQAVIYGLSEGGPMAIMFAVTYPHRVKGLILHGTAPFGARPDQGPEYWDRMEEHARGLASTWGTADSRLIDVFAPSLAGDDEYRSWHQRYERLSADSQSIYELMKISWGVDVRDVLAQVRVPTLVMHATDDRAIPLFAGQMLAEGIPNATLFEYDSPDHFGYADPSLWCDEVERFVTGEVNERPAIPRNTSTVTIKTLGRFDVEIDGEPAPTSAWGSRRARQLCKRLVAARGWPVRREELFEMLWPDETDLSKLGARLSVQLSTVRRVLNGGIVANRQSVALDLDEVDTDLEQLWRNDDPDAILAAYTGEFLPDEVDDLWSSGPRDEARSRAVDAARSLVGTAIDEQRFADAAGYARRLIAIDRYDDAAHTKLVQCLIEQGDVGGAKRAHLARQSAMAELDITIEPLEL